MTSDDDRTCNDGSPGGEPIDLPEVSGELRPLASMGPLHDLRNLGNRKAMLAEMAQRTGGMPEFAKQAAVNMGLLTREEADEIDREARRYNEQ